MALDDKNLKISKLKNFSTWLNNQPHWEQLLWHMHTSKDVLDEVDIDKCTQLLLDDFRVATEKVSRDSLQIVNLDLDGDDEAKGRITLNKIDGLEDVNAIDEICEIEFGKQLTVIYGDNGAGKSGIGRLLSNACLSRKPRQLLPNMNNGLAVSTSRANFHISDGHNQEIISYELGQEYPKLKSFSVFDRECALVHLDKENKIEFVPSKIKIFDNFFNSISKIEEVINQITLQRRKDNPVDGFPLDQSKVSIFLNSISVKTSSEEIEENLSFTEEDQKKLDKNTVELEMKTKQDVSEQKKKLLEESSEINSYKEDLSNKTQLISQKSSSEVNVVIDEIKEKKRILSQLSAKNFDFSLFTHVGSPEWKSLISTAKKIYENEHQLGNGDAKKYCLLCRRPLSDTEEDLFKNYWQFLESTAESELLQARKKLETLIGKLKQESYLLPKFSELESVIKVLKKDIPDELEKIKSSFVSLANQINGWLVLMGKESKVTYIQVDVELDALRGLIKEKEKNANSLVDPKSQINSLKTQIIELEQRKRASVMTKQVKEYVEWLRWNDAIKTINLSAVKRSITIKREEVIKDIVVSKYIGVFNKKTKSLNCDFGLEINSHGREATTVKGLKLKFAGNHNPSEILSEGEQTVSALADFLAEAELDKNNSGIIFDDPVTSLDHSRRSNIAEHLVNEAKNRQVIILTHDVVFLLDLIHYSENEAVDIKTLSMSNNGDKIGVVKKDLPWFALPVSGRVGFLKNDLVRIKKLESGDQDKYRKEVKGWYELLRESWERSVEERLFKGVILRFRKGVETQRLKTVEVTPELVKEVNVGMSESSNWLHDMGAGLNPAIPKNEKLEKELELLEAFITKCKS